MRTRLAKIKRSYFLIMVVACLSVLSITVAFWGDKDIQATPYGKEAGLPVQKHFLHMKGQFRNMKENVSHTKIEIHTTSGVLHQSAVSDKKGWCRFEVPLQSDFIISFSRDGYITKKIRVNTDLPDDLIGDYYCEFDAEMFPQIPEVEAGPLLKEPIASFFFNQSKHNFYYDQVSAGKINSKLKLMYSEYYLAKAKEKNTRPKKETKTIPAVLN